MQNLNIQFEALRQSPTVAMADRILALKASGRRIIGLQVGDPDFPTPPSVVEVAFKAMQDGLTHYGPSKGYPELRRAAGPPGWKMDSLAPTESVVPHGEVCVIEPSSVVEFECASPL